MRHPSIEPPRKLSSGSTPDVFEILDNEYSNVRKIQLLESMKYHALYEGFGMFLSFPKSLNSFVNLTPDEL